MSKVVGNQTLLIESSSIPPLTRLVVKELIESSMKHNRMLDANNGHLKNFFALLENMLLHGFKIKSGIFAGKKDLWSILESIENKPPDGFSIASIVREISNIKTTLGRCRAWLRMAFVQKQLADLFRSLVEKKNELLVDNYEPDAFLLSDEASIVAGYMIGLNIIDLTWFARDEDLDTPHVYFNFRPYLKDIKESWNYNSGTNGGSSSNIQTVLDQKNYLEELNKSLNAKVASLQKQIKSLESSSHLNVIKPIFTNERESNKLSSKKDQIHSPPSPSLSSSIQESCSSSTHNEEGEECTENDLTSPVKSLEIQLTAEKCHRSEIEKKLEILTRTENEKEIALRLVEKDIHEKQDAIISLRRQLEDMKAINKQLFNKLKDSDEMTKVKLNTIKILEQKNLTHDTSILQLNTNISNLEKRVKEMEELNNRLTEKLVEKDQKRVLLESDLRKEREWRTSLQAIVDEQQEQITANQSEMEDLRFRCIDVERLTRECESLRQKCLDYERSLEEIGVQLRESKLETESLKESAGMLKDAVWTKDSDVDNCSRCGRTFSVAQRKHHCRSCGHIFCGRCSDNKLPLPSSAKPVRVCDGCHTLLLDRYCAN